MANATSTPEVGSRTAPNMSRMPKCVLMLCKLHFSNGWRLISSGTESHSAVRCWLLRARRNSATVNLRHCCFNKNRLMLALKSETAGPLLRLPSVKQEYVFHWHWLLLAFPSQLDRRCGINIIRAQNQFRVFWKDSENPEKVSDETFM